MRIYLRKRRLCESRAAVRTDIPSGGSPELCAEHGTNLTGESPVTGIYRQV